MGKQIFFLVAMVCLFTYEALAQSRRPRQAAKAPMDLVRQFVRENDQQDIIDRMYGGDIRKFAAELDVTLAELNRDGKPEYLVVSLYFCGAANCPTFVYQKRNSGGYRLLLNDFNVRPKSIVTNGYRDLAASSQAGVDDIGRATYKYDGREYKMTDCVRTITDRRGRHPRVIRQRCNTLN